MDNAAKKFKSLIRRVANHEKYSLEEFYQTYGKSMRSAAFTVTRSYDLSYEVIDDVLAYVWNHTEKLFDLRNPNAWLYKACRLKAIDKVKYKKPTVELFEMPYNDRSIENIESVDAFDRMIMDLSEEEQQIIIMKELQDFTLKMIAKELGKPFGTVSSTYYRALDKLRKNYKD